MIISTDKEEAFNKNLHPIMIKEKKTPKTSRREELPQTDKG